MRFSTMAIPPGDVLVTPIMIAFVTIAHGAASAAAM